MSAVERYVEAHLPADAASPRVNCTSGVGLPYRQRSPDFVCIAHRSDASCDELRATRRAGGWRIVVTRRDVDCVLPA